MAWDETHLPKLMEEAAGGLENASTVLNIALKIARGYCFDKELKELTEIAETLVPLVNRLGLVTDKIIDYVHSDSDHEYSAGKWDLTVVS